MARTTKRDSAVAGALFASLFASQAAVIAMSPVLAAAASDLHVSTATAGQLRTVTGLSAGITALLLARFAGRLRLGRELLGAAAALAVGSLASAAAPSFPFLVVAQLPVGFGIAVATTVVPLAAAEWVSPEARTQTLSWALNGQPAAWIVGMPLVGIVGRDDWRLGWLVLPFAAALVAGLLVKRGARTERAPRIRPAYSRLRDPMLVRWLGAELLANSGWSATLVFAGALLVESYGSSSALTGFVLALGAAGYVAGNLAARRLARRRPPLNSLVVLAIALAASDGLFGAFRPNLTTSAVLFAAAAFAAGGRTLVATSFAVSMPADVRPAVTSIRAATMQFGYFIGSIVGGAALAIDGYRTLGAAISAFFLASAALLSTQRAGRGNDQLVVTRRPATAAAAHAAADG